jgi:secondary thiamine-phosphate synthase enzyme
MIWQKEIILQPFSKGIHLITETISEQIKDASVSGILHIFLKHTSAGIIINENADPSVRTDFNNFVSHLIPDKFEQFTHVLEGPDDMSAHIKSSVFGQSLTIPIIDGKMALGTWQGIYLCEFRLQGGRRKIVLTVHS